jgi:hypothetical protein
MQPKGYHEVMDPNELIRLIRHRPFKPLRVSLCDGQEYVISHPDLVMVDPFTLHLGLPSPKGLDEPVERVVSIALPHVVRAEPADQPIERK